MANKPEQTFKVGPVRASVFRNPIVHNGQTVNMAKVVIEVRYKDKAGEWKGTNSLSVNDIPKAILALQKAYDYVTSRRDGPDSDSGASSGFSSQVVGTF